MAPETATAEPQLFLEKLELGVTLTIVLMFCRMWDVYVATGRYLSTDFVVCDSKGEAEDSRPHLLRKHRQHQGCVAVVRTQERTKGVEVSYHNIGAPSYQCVHCNASMWYEERINKGNQAINPSFSLCCREVVYVIKFQKRGLPHAHILPWLEDNSKCKTASQIDDIISTELPSPTDDPDGYKAITNYMLHGPCGKDGRYVPYTTEVKNVETMKTEKMHWHNRLLNPSLGRVLFSENVVRGPKDFDELMTVNNRLCHTFKEACFAYGLLNDDMDWTKAISEIQIPKKFLIKSSDSPIKKIVAETYPNFIERQHDDEYLKEQAILTPRNDDVDDINTYMFNKLARKFVAYNSADEICKASTKSLDQQQLHPTMFLNTLNFSGMPPYALCLKRNCQ
nr:ATP-dependent DNA helicase PIF1-like [Tanacetum cinerariifolium]